MTRSLQDELHRLGREIADDPRIPVAMTDDARASAARSALLHYRLRLVGKGAGTAAVVAAVAGVGLGIARLWPHEPEPGTGGPHGEAGTIDVVWDDHSILSPFSTLPQCGSPAPTPVTSVGGLSLEVLEGQPGVYYDTTNTGYATSDAGYFIRNSSFTMSTRTELHGDPNGVLTELVFPDLEHLTPAEGVDSPIVYDPATTSLPLSVFAAVTSSRDVPTSAFVSQPGLIIVKDGVVVGYTDALAFGSVGTLGGDARLLSAGAAPSGWVEVCSGSGVASGELPVGDYELYQVVRVTASPVTAALATRWVAAPVESDYGRGLNPDLVPGTWECANATSGLPASVVECDPNVAVDLAAGTVRLPYPEGSYNDDFDVVLVSEPRPYSVLSQTVIEPPDWEELYFPSEPSCGAEYDMNGPSTGPSIPIPLEHLWPAGDRLDYTAQVMPPEGTRSGTITAAAPFEVWISRTFGMNREDNPHYLPNQHDEIVGHATLILNGGAPILVNRSSGPTDVPAIVSDLEWCPGANRDGDGGIGTRVFIVGVLTWDDGTSPVEIDVSEMVDHQSW